MREGWALLPCPEWRRIGWRHVSLLLAGGMLATVPVHALQRPSLAAPSLATAATPLVFRGVTVIDVQQGRPLPNRTVVIVGNRIQMVVKVAAYELPKGARVVEAGGMYLMAVQWPKDGDQVHSVDLFDPL